MSPQWEMVQEGGGIRTQRLAVTGGFLYRVASLDYWDREYDFALTFAPAKPAAAKSPTRKLKQS